MSGTDAPGILIVVPSLPKWLSDFNILSSALAEAGYDVEMLYPRANGRADSGWDSARIIAASEAGLHPAIRRRRIPFMRNGGRLRVRHLLFTAMQAMKDAAAGNRLFILWSAFPALMFGPWLRLFNRPCLYLITGLGMQFSDRLRGSLRHRTARATYRFLFSSPQAMVIVHNREDRQYLIDETGIDPGRVIVTGGCGVDPESLPFRSAVRVNEVPVILVPSRLLRDKGIMEASEASAMLSARGVAHRMLFTSNPVAGRGDALTQEELDRAAAPPGVEFTGFCDDLADLYAQADLVCIPSWYREGLQTAILEAASAGCPLVACDNVGARDFLRPGVDAVVVPPRQPVALADALESVIRDSARAEEMRRSAYAHFLSGFTQKHMLKITLEVLSRLGIDGMVRDEGARDPSLRTAG